MPYDHSAGVALVEILEQLPHGLLLRSRARVVGLTAGIKSPFIADANRMGIVMMPFDVAVGADHPFRATRLDLSVTTDHVMVADAEVKTSIAVPRIDLSGRGPWIFFARK